MNTKTMRKLAIMIAAICVLLIMAVPSFASQDDMTGKGNGYYLIENETIPTYSTTDTIKVKVIVEGRYSTGTNPTPTPLVANRTVSLTGSTAYTVRDVMLQFNTDSATTKATDRFGQNITSSSTMVDGFKNGSRFYSYLFYNDIGYGYRIPVDCWMFRINSRNPMKSPTPSIPYMQGAMMYETYIKDGDVVYFFFNYPFDIGGTNYSTRFIAADTRYTASNEPNGTGTLEVQLQESRDNHYDANNSYQWTTSSFVNYAPGSQKNVTIYDSNFLTVTTSMTVNSSGYGSYNINLDPGVYYISVGTKTFKTINGYTEETGNATLNCSCLDTTPVYDCFEVPTPTPAS